MFSAGNTNHDKGSHFSNHPYHVKVKQNHQQKTQTLLISPTSRMLRAPLSQHTCWFVIVGTQQVLMITLSIALFISNAPVRQSIWLFLHPCFSYSDISKCSLWKAAWNNTGLTLTSLFLLFYPFSVQAFCTWTHVSRFACKHISLGIFTIPHKRILNWNTESPDTRCYTEIRMRKMKWTQRGKKDWDPFKVVNVEILCQQ